MAINDQWKYAHETTGWVKTGKQLDPSGSGYVPTNWTRVHDDAIPTVISG